MSFASSFSLVVILRCLCPAQAVLAQHCPPIVESYLSECSVKRSESGLTFAFSYQKSGGQPKQAYQIYVVAFADSITERVAKVPPQQAIREGLITVVGTQLMKRDRDGQYPVKYELDTEPFVQRMLKAQQLSNTRTSNVGGWQRYNDRLRLAVFIPFLDDEKYSNLDGLPRDKHECNYRGDSALLFEMIPQRLEVCFGIVQAKRLPKGQHYIQLNGNRPAAYRVK